MRNDNHYCNNDISKGNYCFGILRRFLRNHATPTSYVDFTLAWKRGNVEWSLTQILIG